MEKREAVAIFGSVKNLVAAIGTTRQNWYQYEEPLNNGNVQRIIGAAMLNNYVVPKSILDKYNNEHS